jgi:hypothetical protein
VPSPFLIYGRFSISSARKHEAVRDELHRICPTIRINRVRTSKIRRMAVSFLKPQDWTDCLRGKLPRLAHCHRNVKVRIYIPLGSWQGVPEWERLSRNPQSFYVQTNSQSARMTKIALISLRINALKFAIWLDKCTAEGVPPHLSKAMNMNLSFGELS